MEVIKIDKELSISPNAGSRDNILTIEDFIRNTDGAYVGDSITCPLKHSFSENIYVREIFIPAGHLITGKIHKHEHPNFLLSGVVVYFIWKSQQKEEKNRDIIAIKTGSKI